MPSPRSGSKSRPDGRFVLSIPSSVEALPGARHAFSRWLGSIPVAQDISGELSVAFSELTANAVDASEDGSLDVRVFAWRDGPDLVFEVVNAATGSGQRRRRWNMHDQLRSGGRGLGIVRALVDSVEAHRDAQGRLVMRCRRSLSDTI